VSDPSALAAVSSALLASAGTNRVSVIGGLEAAWSGSKACGPALTVRGAAGDNLALHHAIAEASPNVVIVIDVEGEEEVAHFGDILALAALRRGVRGIVVNGSIRDRAAITELRFPVFHRGTSPRGPAKVIPGELGVPIELMGVRVCAGDLVCADDDGVVIVQAADVDEILALASTIASCEREYESRIAAGDSTVDILDLPRRAS
jgi:4-hydroxy-4-methyl-2-oxoglutarate aldolase